MYKKGLWNVWKRGSFDLILTVYTESQTLVVSRRTHCTHGQLGQHNISYSVFSTTFRASSHDVQYGGASPLMFLASWLDRRSANGREGAPFVHFFSGTLTDGAERRCPSSWGQATHKDDPGQPAGTKWNIDIKIK